LMPSTGAYGASEGNFGERFNLDHGSDGGILKGMHNFSYKI